MHGVLKLLKALACPAHANAQQLTIPITAFCTCTLPPHDLSRWHHIFLPLLPRSLADYLTAPMPFLIGMPAQLLPALKHLPMDEVTLIDLDLAK